jgi:hypothetical protein
LSGNRDLRLKNWVAQTLGALKKWPACQRSDGPQITALSESSPPHRAVAEGVGSIGAAADFGRITG